MYAIFFTSISSIIHYLLNINALGPAVKWKATGCKKQRH